MKREENVTISELNSNAAKKGEPPPYEEFHIDEFEADTETTVRAVRPTQSFRRSAQLETSWSTSASPSSFGNRPFSNSPRKDGEDFLQSDFFQKPPKFLLYPSKTGVDSDTKEDNQNRFYEREEFEERQLSRDKQMEPQSSSNINSEPLGSKNEVPLCPSQLTSHYNGPVQTIITDSYLPRYSHEIMCPNCKVKVKSEVQFVAGQMTHLAALAALWLTCCLVCVPYFINELKDAEHFCPRCNGLLGYNRKKVFEWQ